MKKFILFLFLLTSISIQSANAQDIGDEFADPTLDMGTGTLDVPQGFETSVPTDNNGANIGTMPIESTDQSVQAETPTEEERNFGKPLALEGPALDYSQTGDVVMEQQTNLYQSYKQRRGKHGVLFSVNYEKFYPVDYYSMYRDAYIEDFLGDSESMDLLGAELGYKYNFKLGSLSLLANFATGSKSNSAYNGDNTTARERNLSVTRYGLSINYAADNVMQEPWIVPYGQVGLHQFHVIEDDLNQESAEERTTQISFNYKIGLLFQLNWIEKAIDPNTQIDGLRSSGLQNTFIDLYAMTHMASSEVYDSSSPTSEGDPDMSTGMEIGIGLKMEF